MFIAARHFHESATILTPEPFISLLSTCSVEHTPHGHVADTSLQPMTCSIHKPPSLELRLVQRKGYWVKFPATYVALRVGAHTVHRFDTSPTPSIARHVDPSTTIISCRLRFSQRLRPFKTFKHITPLHCFIIFFLSPNFRNTSANASSPSISVLLNAFLIIKR